MSKTKKRESLEFDVAVITTFIRWVASLEPDIGSVQRFIESPRVIASLVEDARKFRRQGLSEQDSAREAIKLAAVFIAERIKTLDGLILLSDVIRSKDFMAKPKQTPLPPIPAIRPVTAGRLSELTSEPQAA